MKKVLYLISTLVNSGPTNQLSYIIKYLDRNIFEPHVLTLSKEPESSALEYFQSSLQVPVESLSLSRSQGLIQALSKVNHYVKANNFELMHAQGKRADGLIPNIDIPQVSTLRNYPYHDYITKFGRLKGSLMAFGHMRIIKSNSHNCITCSQSIADEFYSNGLQLQSIQNGIDIDKYIPLNDLEREELKDLLGVEADKKIFITVGSLIPRKDVETVIKGFNQYCQVDSNTTLLVIGDGFVKSKLEAISSNNIKFLGNIPNVLEYLQISDCFISAALSEGLPNTVLEAMACGLPTVLSDIAPHRELCGETGSFFDICDPDQLASRLVSCEGQSNNSRNIIVEGFSAEIMSKKYQELYLERLD